MTAGLPVAAPTQKTGTGTYNGYFFSWFSVWEILMM